MDVDFGTIFSGVTAFGATTAAVFLIAGAVRKPFAAFHRRLDGIDTRLEGIDGQLSELAARQKVVEGLLRVIVPEPLKDFAENIIPIDQPRIGSR